MDAFQNYDAWKLDTPDWYDHEYELQGTIEGEEVDVYFEGKTFYAQLTVEFDSDRVESVEIESLVSVVQFLQSSLMDSSIGGINPM